MSYKSISLVFVIVSVLPVTFRASAEHDRLGKNNRIYSVFEMKQFTPQQLTVYNFFFKCRLKYVQKADIPKLHTHPERVHYHGPTSPHTCVQVSVLRLYV